MCHNTSRNDHATKSWPGVHTLRVNTALLPTYLACIVRAATPDMSGVEALVPVKSSVHSPFRVVVV